MAIIFLILFSLCAQAENFEVSTVEGANMKWTFLTREEAQKFIAENPRFQNKYGLEIADKTTEVEARKLQAKRKQEAIERLRSRDCTDSRLSDFQKDVCEAFK